MNPNEIVITVNGKKFNVFDRDGWHLCNASALNFGENTVHIYYPGDEKYGEYSCDANITLTPNIDVKQKTITLGDSVELYIMVPNNVNGTLKASTEYGDELASIDVENGLASVLIKNLPVGLNTIHADFTGSIGSFANTFYITVKPIVTVPQTMIVGEDAYVIVDTTDGSGAYVKVFFKNKDDENSTYEFLSSAGISNNQSKISLSSLPKGCYDLLVEFWYSDTTFSNYTFQLQVTDKLEPKIVANDLAMYHNEGKYYSVTVYGEYGKVVANTTVIFTLNGVQIAKVKTDDNGVARFKVTQTPVTKGKIVSKTLGVTSTKKLTIKRVITLKKVTVKKSAKKLVLTAALKKINGKYLRGKKITFKFNGKKISTRTNAKGVAKVTIKSSVLKKLKVGKKITYQATYLKDTVKMTVKVKK